MPKVIKDDGAITSIINYRWSVHVESFAVSTGRWSVDFGRFHLRPGLHFDIIHLRRGTCQSSANRFPVYDIADTPEIHLLVKNEGTPDRYFTVRFEYVFSRIIEKAVFFITNRAIIGLDFMRNCETGSTTFPNPAAPWCPSASI